METLTGVVTPYTQQAGGAASGTVIDHRSTTMHRFLAVIKTLVKNTPAFKTEETVLEALRDVEMFAKTFIDSKDVNRVIGVRLGYMLGRLFTLAIVVILVNKSDGQNAGLAALAVIVFAFTLQLVTSALFRPRSR